MKEIGAIFRQIRESRHISLEEATEISFAKLPPITPIEH